MFASLLILSGAMSAFAMPLAEYRSRIHQAIAELESATKIENHESAQEHDYRLARVFNTVMQLVPLYQPVEWEDTKILVNNDWLENELKNFQQVSRSSLHSAEILQRVIERLHALEDRLTELDSRNSTAVTTAGKSQEKARLEAIQHRAEFQEKPPEKNILERIWERFKQWLNSLFPGGSGLAPGQMSWASFIAMIFIFALAAGVLAYAISKLVPYLQGKTKLNLERREARIVLGERLAPDRTASDILAEAEALARKGELRAAIRLAYIALLCELGDRKVLALAQYKTNRDYLRAVREKRERPLLDEMQKLTSSFENHWYGFQQTTPDDWTTFRSGYEKVLSFQL